MSERAVAIALKIPDNTAYTALAALRRLGVDAARLERSEIWLFDDLGDPADVSARVESNETIFNPNKHRLVVLDGVKPRVGEVWIEDLGLHDQPREHFGGKAIVGITHVRRYVGWRFLRADGTPEGADVLEAAVTRLLCNPAIERALF